MTLLLCVRHGETDLNRGHRWQGWSDEPLNATGRRQALAAREALDRIPVDLVVTSDLSRAVETAELLLGRRDVPRHVDPAWREVDAGSWTGLTAAEARERDPEGYARYQAGGTGWEGGETYAELQARAARAALDLAAAVDPTSRVLVVCHAGIIRGLAAAALGAAPEVGRSALGRCDYVALSVFGVDPGRIVLVRYNVPLIPTTVRRGVPTGDVTVDLPL